MEQVNTLHYEAAITSTLSFIAVFGNQAPISAVAITNPKNKSLQGNMQILGNQYIIFHKILLF